MGDLQIGQGVTDGSQADQTDQNRVHPRVGLLGMITQIGKTTQGSQHTLDFYTMVTRGFLFYWARAWGQTLPLPFFFRTEACKQKGKCVSHPRWHPPIVARTQGLTQLRGHGRQTGGTALRPLGLRGRGPEWPHNLSLVSLLFLLRLLCGGDEACFLTLLPASHQHSTGGTGGQGCLKKELEAPRAEDRPWLMNS